MAPIKFDNNIKDKLEKRTLQPSGNSWDTLSKKLNAHDKKRSRGLVFYIGIAASIVGVLFVTTLFFNTSEEKSTSSILVDIEVNDAKTEIIENNVASKEIDTELSLIKTKSHAANISEEKKGEKIYKELINENKNEQSITVVKETLIKRQELMPVNKLTLDEAKVIEVVNQIKDLEIKNGTVSDAEIETLLKQAEKDILKQQIYNKTTRTVNADALLQDVEDDLEQSFRTKVFEALKSGYKTVKTAVAERNN